MAQDWTGADYDRWNQRGGRRKQAILDYLARHPFAADSEEGIAQWWLGTAGVLVTADELQQALARLQRQGRIERVPLPGHGAIYRAPRPPSDRH
ncbi:MAG: hypothetical protein QM777_06105 [Pseudorhodoferax sp.]